MENQKKIEKVTGALVFEPKGNEIIDRLNIPWKVTFKPDNLVNTAAFKYGDNEIILEIELNTVNLVACDENGDQKTFTLAGFDASEE